MKKICIIVTAAALLGCLAFPAAANSFSYGLEGRYFSASIMSVRLAGHSCCGKNVYACSRISLQHKKGVWEGKSLNKYGGGSVYTDWTEKSDVRDTRGHCYFYT